MMLAADAWRRTKLVCTIGPATAERIDELVSAGMDVARVNFAHGTDDDHRRAARDVQAAAATSVRPLALLADLAGPKIRLGELADDAIELVAGRPFVLRAGSDGRSTAGNAHGADVSYSRITSDVRPGDLIFLADGAVELRVTTVADDVRTEVVRSGAIRSRAGVSLPAARLSAPVLTGKDRADIARALEMQVAYVGQSFVRSARDVRELRELLGPGGPGIVAKIETRPAVDDFDAILEAADGVMIARGDLGVQLPYEQVPILQKQLVQRALDRGVPSIVATQMLESMTEAPRPTRAEASDVANAVFDGADAIMLSAETAIGRFPLLAAEAAARIARTCELDGERYLPGGPDGIEAAGTKLAGAAAVLAALDQDVAAICCSTRTGRTARLLAALRPRVPIVALSPSANVVAALALVNGLMARHVPALGDDAGTGAALRSLGATGLVPAGAAVAFVTAETAPGTGLQLVGIHRVGGSPAPQERG